MGLKVGFLGAGFIARFQLRALEMVRDIELAGVVSPHSGPALAEDVRARGVGECRVCGSVKELCEISDVVCIFAPNDLRRELMSQIVDAVKAGAALKAVVCEKPLARTVKHAREMIAMAETAGLRTCYFENQLHMKPVRAQMTQLRPQQQAMGPMTLSRCSEEHRGPHSGWFWDPVRQGGGVLSDMGCHSIACGWYILTPLGKPLTFLEPVSVSAEVALLKWGQPKWREWLVREKGVDYARTPAEDFATGIVTFRNPESGQLVKTQFTNSWMYEKQGLRIAMDGIGPGYAFEFSSLETPLTLFIGDAAAEAVSDAESALEKSTATRGLLAVETNEADLYGYVDEWIDLRDAIRDGRPCLADWSYGLEIVKLTTAAYMAAEQGKRIDLTSAAVQKEVEGYVSLIAQGKGREVLYG